LTFWDVKFQQTKLIWYNSYRFCKLVVFIIRTWLTSVNDGDECNVSYAFRRVYRRNVWKGRSSKRDDYVGPYIKLFAIERYYISLFTLLSQYYYTRKKNHNLFILYMKFLLTICPFLYMSKFILTTFNANRIY